MKELRKQNMYRPMYKRGEPWRRFHSLFYNGLLRVDMVPTRFICYQTLQKMGIAGDVRVMLRRMGLEQIACQQYPLYPELVRQFLASAELHFEDGAIPTASEGTLSYFSSGKLYEISIRELCAIYGFDESAESCHFPSDFPQAVELWGVIGSGVYESRGAKLARIRNPVVRVVAKIIGNTIFAKEESGSVKVDELMLMHFGLPPLFREIYSTPPPERLSTNLGVIFAESLVYKKARGLNTKHKKVERIGSLLTPIFRHHGIDLSSTPCETTIHLLDEQHFRNSGILSKRAASTDYIYQYQDRTGAFQHCKLPLIAHTAITSRANLEFSLAPESLYQDPSLLARRGSSSRGATSQPHLEDERVPDDIPPHRQSADFPEFTILEYTGEHDLLPLAAGASIEETLAWVVDSQRKNHAMLRETQSTMRRMWDAITRCPRPPSCFRGSERREDRERTEPTTDVPDVAGHRTTATADSGDPSDTTHRRSRRRHVLGEDDSASSEDH